MSFFHLPWVKELTGTIQDKGAPWSGVWFLGTHHVRELVCLLSLCDRMEGAELWLDQWWDWEAKVQLKEPFLVVSDFMKKVVQERE